LRIWCSGEDLAEWSRAARPADVNAARRQASWPNNPRPANIGRNLPKRRAWLLKR